jgi:RDD family protein
VLGAIVIVLSFLVVFGYDVAFETLASGRTPGKRAAGLRVVRLGGEPPGFLAAAIRNLLRLIDLLPAFYAIGALCILVTARNQRLGDLAAGTLVVRERRPATYAGARPDWAAADLYAADRLAAWDVSAITPFELVTVRRFLERRNDLQPHARAHLASDLAGRLRPKVMGAPEAMSPEAFLESLAQAKSSRS